jgi:hypothetical protein
MIPLEKLQPNDVDKFWPQAKPLIEDAMNHSGTIADIDPEFVLQQIKKNNMHFWIGLDKDEIAVVHVTQFSERPKRKALLILFTGAKKWSIDAWIWHLDVLKEFARQHNCKVVVGGGRFGWIKKLKPDFVRVQFDIEV